ncbi:sister chromatid cohesion 1 protein 3-like [Zingiber officinale]|uniref:sister chromatid cohesion 1 protein 3-like n=1 Tax=Zingiber officinale TaxID=94328 RepID=UPI001C4BF3BC|nr:sister chromatid cohesion 1 protein 3-like [Zingiber officinale]XP_042432152.1 sister chromatid cohesion 1 protein 3-like [Zingiber officinale]
MFYSHSLLAKKSPLGMVWIAAHLQKMKKTQVDGVDIRSSAEEIMYPRAPIALRLSGHLLVGLVRIYSWKVNYLFQDCNRMLTNIRVTVASIQVNLPANADKAPFESITLPETFDLDALELDDSINPTDGLDNHQKDYEQITLAGEASVGQDQYVAFFIDKDNSTNSSIQPEIRNDAEPMEEDVLPPFDGGLDAIVSPALNSASFDGPVSNNHGNDSFQTFDVNNNIQEFQEIEVMRQNNLEPENQLELDNTSNGVELHDHSTSVAKRKHSLDPILEDILVSGEEPLPSTSHAKSPMSTFDSNIANREISSGQVLPYLELELQPSPPVRELKRKRRMKIHSYDEKIVLANADMKKQLEDTTKFVCKRRKLPCSALYLYKYHSNRLNDKVLHEPLLSGMCSYLQEVFSRSFPLHSNNSSHMEVSSELANELSHVTSKDLQKEPEQQNNLDGEIERHCDRNMEPEQQDKMNAIPENSRFDMHTDIEPEQQVELNLIPENPRFDMHTGATINETIQSPYGGVDMTPFNTTIEGSTRDFDKTFDTEILPTVESFARTEATSYATGASLFSLEEEPLQNSMPTIPSVLLSGEEDFDFLDASIQSSGYKENEAGTLSARTRAVAQFLKNQSPSQSQDKEHGVLSLNDILEGKTRRRCAQMFFESLVLKTYGFVDVQQEEAYGDIVISPTPALFATKF